MTRALVILLMMMVAVPALANARDPDGSRMQAAELKIGKSDSDRLSPPRDSVDWRFFRVKEAGNYTIDVSGKSDSGIKLQLSTATGKSIATESSKGGRATISRKLSPGLYYFAVSATGATEYRVSVR